MNYKRLHFYHYVTPYFFHYNNTNEKQEAAWISHKQIFKCSLPPLNRPIARILCQRYFVNLQGSEFIHPYFINKIFMFAIQNRSDQAQTIKRAHITERVFLFTVKCPKIILHLALQFLKLPLVIEKM